MIKTKFTYSFVVLLSNYFNVMFSLYILSGLISVIFNIQGDCDEAYNYWEPMHLVFTNKTSFQTWEYSPEFALRSYFFLLIFGFPIILGKILEYHNSINFLLVRFFLSLTSSLPHYFFTKSFSKSNNYLLVIYSFITFISPSYFLTCTNLVPSAISNSFTLLSLYFSMMDNYFFSIGIIAFISIVLWPFCCILGIPIFFNSLYKKGLYYTLKVTIFWGIIWSTPIFITDSYFFGKPVLAPINILKYNVFGSIFYEGTSSELYGTEDLTYYLKNLALNFHIILPLFIVSLPISLILFIFKRDFSKSDQGLISILCYSTCMIILWFLVFFSQPHKEERFLYPVYNLISLNSAVSIFIILKYLHQRSNYVLKVISRLFQILFSLFLILSLILSISRISAIHMNYSAPIKLINHLNSTENNQVLCLGRAWHLFPNRFIIGNENLKIEFIPSNFGGQLPAKYKESASIIEATSQDGGKFNLFNLREEDRFIKTKLPSEYCTFVLDYDEDYSTEEFNFAINSNYTIYEEINMLSQAKESSISNPLLTKLYTHIFYIPSLYNIENRKMSLRIYRLKK